ncbi:MAG TPA: vitamin K epoxide reductase family protein, partial [Polyangiaceae bacterium]|nr:vitamin K epoxide reductase family protein [Polyangiaceae bacterium]
MKREQASAIGWSAASLVPALVGIGFSSALVVDYLRPRPVFCGEGGGCEAVRQTVFAAPFGVPLPVIGVAGFLAIGVAALSSGARARLAQLLLSAGAGLLGGFLLLVQARLGQVCPYCVVVDACGIASAVTAAARFGFAPDTAIPRPASWSAAALLVAATALPLVVGFRASPVPGVIRDEMARAPKGQVTIVDFVDFECPFCRMTHAELEPLVRSRRDRIHLVRLQVPLRVHPHALDAARAACCGERFGKADEMADALFAAPVAELTRQGCEAIAERLGIPLDPFRSCVDDPGTLARIEHDRDEFKRAGGHALPTIW